MAAPQGGKQSIAEAEQDKIQAGTPTKSGPHITPQQIPAVVGPSRRWPRVPFVTLPATLVAS